MITSRKCRAAPGKVHKTKSEEADAGRSTIAAVDWHDKVNMATKGAERSRISPAKSNGVLHEEACIGDFIAFLRCKPLSDAP